MIYLPKSLQQFQAPKVIVLLFLLALVIFGALPAYLNGQLPWNRQPQISTLKELQSLRKTGLTLPGWPTTPPQPVQVGGRRWTAQTIKPSASIPAGLLPEEAQMLLLFYPQDSRTSQPLVEWLDVNGFLSASQIQATNRSGTSPVPQTQPSNSPAWQTDNFQLLPITLDQTGGLRPTITISFFRGRTPTQTYALLQWYAWPNGGHPDTHQLFWADQAAQLRGKRLPWVAVCVLIPIEPLGDITKVRAIAEPLSRAIQSVLMAGPLQPK